MLSQLANNGPAKKGGCVTRRRIRVGSRYFSQNAVPVQGGYGTCFCSPGTESCGHYGCRGTRFLRSRECVWVLKSLLIAVVQGRGTNLVGAGKLSPCRILIECNGGRPGTRTAGSCFSSTVCKNRDKQLTFIVRVSIRCVFQLSVLYLSCILTS